MNKVIKNLYYDSIADGYYYSLFKLDVKDFLEHGLDRDDLLDLAKDIYKHLERNSLENIDKTNFSNILDYTFTGSKKDFEKLSDKDIDSIIDFVFDWFNLIEDEVEDEMYKYFYDDAFEYYQNNDILIEDEVKKDAGNVEAGVQFFNSTSLSENSNKYRRVKRALFGDPTGKIKTFAIIVAENPLGWKDSTEEEFKQQYAKWTQVPQKYNKEKLDKITSTELLHKIETNGDTIMKYGGYNYVQIKGKFDNNYEKSFIIFNIPLVDAKAIARGYGQLSFWWGKVSNNEDEPSSIGYYETNNACVTYKLIEVSNTIVSMEDAEDMFSKYGFKFKINLNYFGDDVKEPSNAKEFEESLEEEHSTFMSRAIHRRRAYKQDK